MKATYKEIPDLLEDLQSFDGNSVKARWYDKLDNYVVWSYNTVIFEKQGDKIYFNRKKYSTTTSRLQNILRDVFDLEEVK